MSLIEDTAGRPRRTDAWSGDRHAASPVEVCATFLGAGPIERIEMIRRGILASDAERILSGLTVTRAAAMAALDISATTMKRRVKGQDRLPPAESERVLGLARLVGQVREIVEDSGNPQGFDAAAWMFRWLNEPLPALSGIRPLDLLDTMEGQGLVSRTLAHVRGGAYA